MDLHASSAAEYWLHTTTTLHALADQDVYAELPQNLKDQKANLKKFLDKYADKYDFSRIESSAEFPHPAAAAAATGKTSPTK